MKRTIAGPLLLVAVASACEGAGPGATAAGMQATDSAGVRVVELGRELERLADPVSDATPAFRVGVEGSGVELFRVSAAGFLPDGRLVIGNSGVPEVLVVGPEGALVDRLGDRGEGPGQFGEITSVHPQPDGSIVVYDDRQGRLTVFSGAAAPETRRMADPSSISDVRPITASQQGPVLAVFGDNRMFMRSGVRHDSTPLMRFPPESTLPDTIGRWASSAWSFESVGDGITRSSLPFGPALHTSGSASAAVLAESHRTRVTVLRPDGEVAMLLRWTEEPRTVSDADVRAWYAERERELPAGSSTPAHEAHHPVIDGVLAGRDGSVWVAPTRLATDSVQVWLRFDDRGEPLPAVRLDRGVRLLDAEGDRVAVLARDELSVETVVVMEIRPR